MNPIQRGVRLRQDPDVETEINISIAEPRSRGPLPVPGRVSEARRRSSGPRPNSMGVMIRQEESFENKEVSIFSTENYEAITTVA